MHDRRLAGQDGAPCWPGARRAWPFPPAAAPNGRPWRQRPRSVTGAAEGSGPSYQCHSPEGPGRPNPCRGRPGRYRLHLPRQPGWAGTHIALQVEFTRRIGLSAPSRGRCPVAGPCGRRRSSCCAPHAAWRSRRRPLTGLGIGMAAATRTSSWRPGACRADPVAQASPEARRSARVMTVLPRECRPPPRDPSARGLRSTRTARCVAYLSVRSCQMHRPCAVSCRLRPDRKPAAIRPQSRNAEIIIAINKRWTARTGLLMTHIAIIIVAPTRKRVPP